MVICAIGLFAAWKAPAAEAQPTEHKKLAGRRDKLMQELVKLEHDHRRGKVDPARFAARREELINALEGVYAALATP